jgi:methylenetetrahydrofolate dehydrogenase (NADP+)/methenyltetrahydrofolate cyclohydrolase
MVKVLSGAPLRDRIKDELRSALSSVPPQEIPGLAIIQVGDNQSSTIYIQAKIKFGKEIGVETHLHHFPEEASQEEIITRIEELNKNAEVGGIIVQLPLPAHIDQNAIIEAIDSEKDVDGLHSSNVEKLLNNDPSGIVPATTRGILSLLDYYQIDLKGKKVLVIGRSALVGKPTAVACTNRGATVTVAHSETTNISDLSRQADIIISAAGAPGLINKDYVKKGQVIIDVGISRKDGKIMGDVDFDTVSEEVAAVSPVPGGVGLLTVASLFQNLLRRYT